MVNNQNKLRTIIQEDSLRLYDSSRAGVGRGAEREKGGCACSLNLSIWGKLLLSSHGFQMSKSHAMTCFMTESHLMKERGALFMHQSEKPLFENPEKDVKVNHKLVRLLLRKHI